MFAGMKFAIGVVSERIFIIYTTPGYLSLSTVISIQKLLNTICPPRVSKKGAHDNNEKKRKEVRHTHRERERRERRYQTTRDGRSFPFEPTARLFLCVVFGEKNAKTLNYTFFKNFSNLSFAVVKRKSDDDDAF